MKYVLLSLAIGLVLLPRPTFGQDAYVDDDGQVKFVVPSDFEVVVMEVTSDQLDTLVPPAETPLPFVDSLVSARSITFFSPPSVLGTGDYETGITYTGDSVEFGDRIPFLFGTVASRSFDANFPICQGRPCNAIPEPKSGIAILVGVGCLLPLRRRRR